jgi:hypothetical protein
MLIKKLEEKFDQLEQSRNISEPIVPMLPAEEKVQFRSDRSNLYEGSDRDAVDYSQSSVSDDE